MVGNFPLPFEVTKISREVTTTVDELGNDITVEEEIPAKVSVAGWAQPQGAEPKLAGHQRQTVDVELFAPIGVFSEHDAVILPDSGRRFEVVGAPGSYEHNPFGWEPGLEVINLAYIS